jgi:DNA-directed RNA polymerase subunit F
MESDDLIEHLVGAMFSNLFYAEGITSQTIKQYSAAELFEILSKPEKTRFWHTDGLRLVSWESYLKIAEEIYNRNTESEGGAPINSVCAIVITYMALEEMVNNFIHNCLFVKGWKHEQIDIELKRESLSAKLDEYLKSITGHSLKVDHYKLWATFQRARRIRNEKAHNTVMPIIFGDNRLVPEESYYDKVAVEFLKVVPEIEEYLESIYPDEYHTFNTELHEIWQVVKKKLGMDGGYWERFVHFMQSINKPES